MPRRDMALASVILRCYSCNAIGDAKSAQTRLAIWAMQKRTAKNANAPNCRDRILRNTDSRRRDAVAPGANTSPVYGAQIAGAAIPASIVHDTATDAAQRDDAANRLRCWQVRRQGEQQGARHKRDGRLTNAMVHM
jgi:hypothetical protein